MSKPHRTKLPGHTGNPFDRLIHFLDRIQRIPSFIFVFILLLLAVLPSRGNWQYAGIVWAFFLSDWLSLSLLPRLKRSFGPSKPPTLILALLRFIFAWLPVPLSLVLQGVGTFLVIYAFWIEPFRLQTTHQKLGSPLCKPNRPLRLLHLGDLHLERITARERKLQEQIEKLQPDLILFSGDVLNLSYRRDPAAWQAAREVISAWHAPLGVYLVSGSPAVDLPDVFPELVRDLPIHWLQDERITLNFDGARLDIIGLDCTHDPGADAVKLYALLPEKPENFTILLYHSPDLAPVAANAGIHLQLSGHTHAGQVRLPWYGALFTASLYKKRFESGKIRLGQMTLYVTRGIGMEGAGAPRVRFLCRPEIIIWELCGD